MSVHYNTYLQIFISRQMRHELITTAYMIGEKGMFSRSAKRFIQEGIDRYKASLTPKERAAYEDIMKNVILKDEAEGFTSGRKRVNANYVPKHKKNKEEVVLK